VRCGGAVAAALILVSSAAAPLHAQQPGETTVVPVPGTELSFTLAYVPSGTFRMGSPPEESARDTDEGPVHAVRVPGFWMTIHEVTAEQFSPYRFPEFDGDLGPAGPGSFDVDAVTRPSPPYEDPTHGMGSGDHPATGMTRWNALHYARWLSEKTGRLFRLPTEAEWEYACRAGADGAFGFGDDSAELTDHAWVEANSEGSHHAVGTRPGNRWGIHDLHGNVAEWVMDGYRADSYGDRADRGVVEAPLEGSPSQGQGVVRGGAFDDAPEAARCAARTPESRAWKQRDPQIPKSRWWNTDAPHVGFRLVSPAEELTLEEIRAYWDGILGV
jgi:sulfatase modifying factor 1